MNPIRRLPLVAALTALVVTTAGCGGSASGGPGGSQGAPSARESNIGIQGPEAPQVLSVGPVALPLRSADLLVYGSAPITGAQTRAIEADPGVDASLTFSLARASVQDRVLSIAAVDPAEFRRYTPQATATQQAVWQRVAEGELAMDGGLDRKLVDDAGNLALGNEADAPTLHVGAFAAQVPQISLVVNREWGTRLGMPVDNAVLISTGEVAPQRVKARLARALGDAMSVQLLGPDLDVNAVQTAVLTGGTVGSAVGTFTYSVLGGGRIAPDPAWVGANIRSEPVPVLGNVTCHRAMLPQLRAALTEVVQRGLAEKIHPGEYAGCYYPRFIANTTSLSNHSFGTALDVNVPGNQRGTRGEIDRTVVQIFKKWGFAWGGDWNWTDPMHFELARIVEVR